MAQRFNVDVRQGDIVVVATDGLFDNVYPDEAASIVAAAKVRRKRMQACPDVRAAHPVRAAMLVGLASACLGLPCACRRFVMRPRAKERFLVLLGGKEGCVMCLPSVEAWPCFGQLPFVRQ